MYLLETMTDTPGLLDMLRRITIGDRHGMQQNVIGEGIVVAEMIGEMTGLGTDGSGLIEVTIEIRTGIESVQGIETGLCREIGRG